MIARPASATLSRLSRIHEICVSDLPWIFGCPASTASGSAACADGCRSSGAVTSPPSKAMLQVPAAVSVDPPRSQGVMRQPMRPKLLDQPQPPPVSQS